MTEPTPAAMDERPAQARHGAAGWAVLAWLVVTAGRFAWAAVTGFGTSNVPWWSTIATAAVALLALAAAVPFTRFRRSGWEMAMWVLVTALVMDVARVVLGTPRWLPAALAAGASAFCLGWLWRARAAFRGDDDWADAGDADHRPAPSATRTVAPASASAAAPAADPVAEVLAAIHRKIVEAGSACAVPREALLEIAVRRGVQPDALRRAALPLYRTFLDYFLADGPLTAEEDRELFCLESKLALDAIAVARLRAEREAREHPAAPRAVDEPPALDEPTLPADATPIFAREDDDADDADRIYTPGLAGNGAGLADYEEHELSALVRWAGISLPAGAEPREALETLRALHRISTEPLEQVEPGMPLNQGERCFAVRTVELYRVAPGAQPDPAAPAQGPLDAATFIDGSLARECDLSRYQRAGACHFLVTDRRLLLVGPSGQQSPLPLDRIRAAQPHANGLEVHPLRGNPVFLGFRDGVAGVAMRIRRVLSDAHDARGARPA